MYLLHFTTSNPTFWRFHLTLAVCSDSLRFSHFCHPRVASEETLFWFHTCPYKFTSAVRKIKHFYWSIGVYMRKLTPARVSYWDDFLISYYVYMMTGSFHITLFEGTLHVDKIHVCLKITSITYELPVPVYRQTNFNTETGGPFAFT